VYPVWAIYEQVCVAACDCGHLKLAKVPPCILDIVSFPAIIFLVSVISEIEFSVNLCRVVN